jgi:hypothetical protein
VNELNNYQEVNYIIDVKVDTCYVSNYDFYKYVMKLNLYNPSSDTFYIHKPKSIFSIAFKSEFDTFSDALFIIDEKYLELNSKENVTNTQDYFPDILFTDSAYLYQNYFSKYLMNTDSITLMPYTNTNLICIFQISPYSESSIKYININDGINSPKFYLKVRTIDNNNTWNYILITEGQKIIKSIY